MTAKKFYDWQTVGGTDDVMRLVDCLERADTLQGKMKAWGDAERRQSKRLKDLGDIARLIEAHPHLWESLTAELKQQIERPMPLGFE